MFDQFVLITRSAEEYVERIIKQGYTEWVTDECDQIGHIYEYGPGNKPIGTRYVSTHAKMFFNYDVMPGQVFEVIEYDKRDWLSLIWPMDDVKSGKPLIQITQVVESMERGLFHANLNGLWPKFRYRTTNHTSPRLTQEGRWFDHAVFQTTKDYGFVKKIMEKRYHNPKECGNG